MTPWYEELFRNYGNRYDDEIFTQGTTGECDFIEKEIAGDKRTRILDIGCGTGRHALELARRGYAVTGIDLSLSLLDRAKEKAAAQGLTVDFRCGDARELPFAAEFDLAIMLCEGAFPLMETDEMNFRILEGAARALKPGGKLIFTTLNGLFPLFHSLDAFFNAGQKEGLAEYSDHHFDLMTFRDRNTTTIVDDQGRRKELRCDERYYVPCEITWLLQSLGFGPIGIFGAKLGAFSRSDRLKPDDFEMLVVAER
jgi:SAM-dependent methyltransferase